MQGVEKDVKAAAAGWKRAGALNALAFVYIATLSVAFAAGLFPLVIGIALAAGLLMGGAVLAGWAVYSSYKVIQTARRNSQNLKTAKSGESSVSTLSETAKDRLNKLEGLQRIIEFEQTPGMEKAAVELDGATLNSCTSEGVGSGGNRVSYYLALSRMENVGGGAMKTHPPITQVTQKVNREGKKQTYTAYYEEITFTFDQEKRNELTQKGVTVIKGFFPSANGGNKYEWKELDLTSIELGEVVRYVFPTRLEIRSDGGSSQSLKAAEHQQKEEEVICGQHHSGSSSPRL